MYRAAIAITLAEVLATTAAISQEVAYRDTNPAISPNGKYVAFYSDRSGNDDEYLLELETGQVRRLTDSPLDEYGPAWSPDSRFVYFYRGEQGRFEVFRVDIGEGSTAEQVTALGGYVGNPDISPSGREMLVSWNQGIAGNDYEVFVVDLETSALTQLTDNDANEYTPTWSPDGSMIAFNSNRDGEQFDVWVMEASGRKPRKLVDLHAHDYYTSWTPDGQWIAFFSGPDFDSFDAYKVHLKTGEVVRLTEGLGAGKVSFSSDGELMILGADHSEGGRLFRGKPDGTDLKLLLQ